MPPPHVKYHPVELLHTPIDPETGTVLDFASWNEEVTLRTLSTVIQRLGGSTQGAAPEQLKYPSVLDTSRLYCARTEPGDRTAAILTPITPWTTPPVEDFMIHQQCQQPKATIPKTAKELDRRPLRISKENALQSADGWQWRYSWACWLSSEKEEESCRKLRSRYQNIQRDLRQQWTPAAC